MVKGSSSLVILVIISTVIKCEVNNLSLKDLQQLKESFHQAAINLEFQAQKQHAAICIGAPRSGKSTLINYLIGNKLIGKREFRGHPVSISKADNSPGPAIASGPTSKTTFPTRWNSTKFVEISFWDTPGLDDNRGPVQDITNAIYLYQLIQHVESLRIVLVVDINDILGDNVQQFISVLNALEKIFNNRMKDFYRSISVIFTKVPNVIHDGPVNIEMINDLLTEKVLLSRNMSISQDLRGFVQFLVMNNQQIGFFKRAEIGPVTSDVDVNIFEAIKNSRRAENHLLKEVCPSVSESSMIVLFKSRESLFEQSTFERLQTTIRNVVELLIKENESVERTSNLKSELNMAYEHLSDIRSKIYETFKSSLSFSQKLDILQTIDPIISRQIQEQDILEKAQLMEFVDKLLGLKKSNEFNINLQGVLLYSLATVTESIVSISLQLGKINRMESEKLLEQQRIENQRQQEVLTNKLIEIQKQNAERENFIMNIIQKVVTFVIEKVASKFQGK